MWVVSSCWFAAAEGEFSEGDWRSASRRQQNLYASWWRFLPVIYGHFSQFNCPSHSRSACAKCTFMQPPMRRMRICFTDVFFCFFLLFPSATKMPDNHSWLHFPRYHLVKVSWKSIQPFLGTAERIFMKLLPNDSGENGVCIAVPKWG